VRTAATVYFANKADIEGQNDVRRAVPFDRWRATALLTLEAYAKVRKSSRAESSRTASSARCASAST
jgi:hypothetical protein